MKTIIAGGRTINDYNLLLNAIAQCQFAITAVVSGKAKGADALGERYANEHNLPIHEFPADWKRFGRGAGAQRNTEMAKNAEALLALWDGHSKGTKNMIDNAKRLGLTVSIYLTDTQ
jgi:hypothetical protein